MAVGDHGLRRDPFYPLVELAGRELQGGRSWSESERSPDDDQILESGFGNDVSGVEGVAANRFSDGVILVILLRLPVAVSTRV
ncbi:hypothetical protein O9K51_09052 [Purpureocillium lavendulum]|uniref:Uncharacterized protein n=1 Tax=Purpureocillium lavendulum TaxID=1247861 RepID=A0AB34FGU8_9HYPO|nr:hypothetical protein O9K51_09052 [Purpureocillium lavendulum]